MKFKGKLIRNHSLFVFKSLKYRNILQGGFAQVFEQQPNGKGAKDATLNFNSQYEATSPVWTSVHGFVPVKRVSPTNKNWLYRYKQNWGYRHYFTTLVHDQCRSNPVAGPRWGLFCFLYSSPVASSCTASVIFSCNWALHWARFPAIKLSGWITGWIGTG